MNVAPVYLFWEGETLLDAPVERAWPHVIDYPSWQSYSLVQHVSGPPGEEGEVVLLKKEEGGEFPPYYARTIKLEPGRRIVWKTYPQIRAEGNDYFGIVEFRLLSAGGKTRFCHESLYEFMVPYRDESELEAFRKRSYEGAAMMFESILPKLKTRLATSS